MAGDDTLDGLAHRLLSRDRGTRTMVAIAGPPGVGKSTFAETLCDRLNGAEADVAAVLPMDGFHYDDHVLNARGDRPRKGAPHTFDVGGLAALLSRLRTNAEDEIAVPVFDRDIEIARAGARIISRSVPIILVEGNYLLLDRPGWRDLRDHFDLTVMLTAPYATIKARLGGRWDGYGLTGDALDAKMNGNDLTNVRTVLEASTAADITISTDE